MLARRIIPCLDVKNGRNVRGVKFSADKDAGDPIELAKRYDVEGADELVFYDITASAEKRDIVGKLVRRVSEEVFIPFTVGGGRSHVSGHSHNYRRGRGKSVDQFGSRTHA